MTEPAGKFELFYSYARKDEKLRDELNKHLFNLRNQGLIEDWYDRNISAGTDWAEASNAHLNSAKIILLLISPDFMASDYCYSTEMQRALERDASGEARVIPIILKHADWEGAPFSKLQPLPKNGRPIAKWKDRNEYFVEIARGIREALKEMGATSTTQRAPSPMQQVPIATPKEPLPAPIEPPSVVPIEPLPIVEAEPVWNVPYQQNELFTGRDALLQELRTIFTNEVVASRKSAVVLSGLGGVGKTQTALEYAYRQRVEYRDVFWVHADSRELLTAELASFATLLKLPGQRAEDQQYALDAVKRWFEVHDNWLLVLDNIEDFKMAQNYLPPKPKGHILFTARKQVMGGAAQRLEIKELFPEEGALLLLRRIGLLSSTTTLADAPPLEREQALQIVKLLGCLPLAIDQAGAYIDETGASFPRYLDLYGKRGTYLRQKRGDTSSDHPESVATTLSLSFEKLAEANPAALELLRFFAFLQPDAIPEALLEQSASQLGTVLQDIVSDPIQLDELLGELRRYSLIRRNPVEATLTLHRLVQDVLRDSMDDAVQRQWAERVIQSVNHVFPEVEFANWPICQQYLPQAQSCVALIETWHFTFPEATGLLHETGYYLHERGQYTEAALLLKQALEIREQTLETNHLDVAETLNQLAEAYRNQARYAEAEPLYKRALVIRESVLGAEHPDVGTSLNNLARPYHHLARYAEAEELYKRALAIREQVLDPVHPDIAHSLNDLATLYDDQGRYEEAEPLYKRALAIREKELGSEHPDTVNSLAHLASLYSYQKRYQEAEQLCKQSLAICEKVLGLHHPDTARYLNNLASNYTYTESVPHEEIEQLYKRALTIREGTLGLQHPYTASSLTNLARFYLRRGRYIEAEPLCKRALIIYEQKLGPDHPDTAKSLSTLATLYAHKRDYKRSEPLYERALNIREQKLGPEHPSTVMVRQNYLSLLVAMGKVKKAAEVEARMKTT